MDAKYNNSPFSIEKGGGNTNKPTGQADLTSCSHPFLAIVSTGFHCNKRLEYRPSASYLLTADGDLVLSDLKVPPD